MWFGLFFIVIFILFLAGIFSIVHTPLTRIALTTSNVQCVDNKPTPTFPETETSIKQQCIQECTKINAATKDAELLCDEVRTSSGAPLEGPKPYCQCLQTLLDKIIKPYNA